MNFAPLIVRYHFVPIIIYNYKMRCCSFDFENRLQREFEFYSECYSPDKQMFTRKVACLEMNTQ